MILRIIYTILFCLSLVALLTLFTGNINGPASVQDRGYTGAPGEPGTTCSVCHGLNGNYGLVNIIATALPEYTPIGVNDYQFNVSTTAGFPFGFGMQATVVDAVTGDPVNLNYTNLSSNLKVTTLSNGRKYVEHNNISGTNVFNFSFQVNYPTPQDAPNQISVHYAAVAANANGQNTDDSGSLGNILTQDKNAFLPVVLSDFEASPARNGIQLDWVTETEQNSDYFVVEHAADGMNFRPLETVNGAGDSQISNAYTYTHTTPLNGSNYYRIGMVDFDGQMIYSRVVAERFSSTPGGVRVFPNPAYAETTVQLRASTDESAMLEVYDLSGKLMYHRTVGLTEGDNYIDVNCSEWIPNHYFVRVYGEQFGEELIQMVKK